MKLEYWIALGVALALGVSHSIAYYQGRSAGKAIVQLEWDQAVAEATAAKLKKKEVQDEIITAPIDVSITMRRLRNGSF
jgi:membrane protein DedA with SNARE-associated domain